MADIGYVALVLALGASAFGLAASLWGAFKGYRELVESARNAVLAVAFLVTLASAILFILLATHDFQVRYVAEYTSRSMATPYVLAAFWAGNVGSMLFVAWALSLFSAAAMLATRNRLRELAPYITAILAVNLLFFLALTVFLANPFTKLPFVPSDGRGLNPLLENFGMLTHPPALMVGYMGFTVPFAFAMAALISGNAGSLWVNAVRRWALVPWLFLGAGLVSGAGWAYVELGWGGYWGWDPVENAALMPWLTATAFLHSIVIQKRRGMLKVWNVVLIILTFHLSLFGTFLDRSGLLSSVHAFASSTFGILFLSFIGLSLLGSVVLLWVRLPHLRSETELESLVSKESAFLLNNLVFLAIAFATLWGTVFPLISEAIRGVKITVGPPFFNQVNGPLLLLLLVLMGIGPVMAWRRASRRNILRNFLAPVLTAAVLAVLLYVLGVRKGLALAAFSICGFVAVTVFQEWVRGTGTRHHSLKENYLKAFLGLIGSNRPRYGGYIIHLGILVMAVGIAGSYFYKVEQEATVMPGDSFTVKGYEFTYQDFSRSTTPDKMITATKLIVYNGGEYVGEMHPEKQLHRSFDQGVTEVAIRYTPREDLYVALGSIADNGLATFKVYVNPLVLWIWVGAGVVLAGGLVAYWPGKESSPAHI